MYRTPSEPCLPSDVWYHKSFGKLQPGLISWQKKIDITDTNGMVHLVSVFLLGAGLWGTLPPAGRTEVGEPSPHRRSPCSPWRENLGQKMEQTQQKHEEGDTASTVSICGDLK